MNEVGSKNTPQVQFHVPSDLDYVYRDIVNVYVGSGDVVMEFGNHHRTLPGHAGISNRIVMSLPNAYSLVKKLGQALEKSLEEAQGHLQEEIGEAVKRSV